MLLIEYLLFQISHIVVDEAHCVATWGHAEAGEEAFRAAFAGLRVVRSILPNVKVCILHFNIICIDIGPHLQYWPGE